MGDSLAILFYLREQLHNYLDVIENNSYHLNKHFRKGVLNELINEKLEVIYALDIQIKELLKYPFYESCCFKPISEHWIKEKLVAQVRNNAEAKFVLDMFESELLLWASKKIVSATVDTISYNIVLEILIFSNGSKEFIKVA